MWNRDESEGGRKMTRKGKEGKGMKYVEMRDNCKEVKDVQYRVGEERIIKQAVKYSNVAMLGCGAHLRSISP